MLAGFRRRPRLGETVPRRWLTTPYVSDRRSALGWLAATLIVASVAAGLLAVSTRLLHTDDADVRVLEAVTLFLAAAAYLSYALAHHRVLRELVTRSILVSAFALWGIVQLAPGFADVALLNDVTILLFVAELAFLLSPWA
jgi:hypothetical protein